MSKKEIELAELSLLMEALCEERLSATESARLEEIVLSDPDAMQFYLNYSHLHGTLYWDQALGSDAMIPVVTAVEEEIAEEAAVEEDGEVTVAETIKRPTVSRKNRWVAGITSVCLLVAFMVVFNSWLKKEDASGLAENPPNQNQPLEGSHGTPENLATVPSTKQTRSIHIEPSQHPMLRFQKNNTPNSLNDLPLVATKPKQLAPVEQLPTGASDEAIITFINHRIQDGWAAANITSSPFATDEEWVRRVYLDVIGRIPTATEAEQFLKSRQPDKHQRLVQQLTENPTYVTNWSTIWTRLLIGRTMSREINRRALQDFLVQSFAENRPWSEIVYDLVSAEGDADTNGATNFLLAHLNNQAVPATAITTRLFLGTQIQCTQCHNHPFNNATQSQFWEINSFFKQTKVVRKKNMGEKGEAKAPKLTLVSLSKGGTTFYETRQGLMQPAYPKFAGVKISDGPGVNRRQELARLMTSGKTNQLARAMVNRMWAHFFGYGFTRPVDDMGYHNSPTHPELLDQLARQFVDSGYDIKQLIQWICLSDAYRLSSRFQNDNVADNPEDGSTPNFSRMYVKQMTAEQLYDSLQVTAKPTQIVTDYSTAWNKMQKRDKWLQQFIYTLQNEENDETTTLDGTITQALLMMNGPLVKQSLDLKQDGSILTQALKERTPDARIRKLSLAALSRYPSSRELTELKRLVKERTKFLTARNVPLQSAVQQSYQDVYWAYLNSNEFILIH
ncbi:DUF1549 and DUF1553 domain-containing protein [Gimesia fumaroli]|uniref:DUF1553 domain-containing protein n=1 Tax=Gimesia fumaroli TaxID=2527976 RepID=A0A518IK40_9PLAN|nr:DUF1549 and DUF1553 domain-containing protein [Gimesia fumaroli]QDV53471.1 hypothetical protein Enr17x_55460 [Gimesia fumaroli]